MTFTLDQLKKRAAASGAELIVLQGNGNLPGDMRGKTGKELWLCGPANTDKKLIYAAALTNVPKSCTPAKWLLNRCLNL